MTPFLLLLLLGSNALGAWLLIRHRRNVRHHRFSMGLIGSDPRLTETLHQRLCERQPDIDWLNPNVMRRKVSAWLNRNHD